MSPHVLGLVALGFGIFFLWRAFQTLRTLGPCSPAQRRAKYSLAAVFLYGIVGFFGQGAAAGGFAALLPDWFEWPAVWEEGAVTDARGRTFVPLRSVGRIQVYDANWRFQHGWAVRAAGGRFKLRLTPSGDVEVHTARGDRLFVFDTSGRLLREDTSTEYGRIPERHTPRVTRAWPPFWPLGSPALAWLLLATGLVGLSILKQQIRRQAARHKKSPSGALPWS